MSQEFKALPNISDVQLLRPLVLRRDFFLLQIAIYSTTHTCRPSFTIRPIHCSEVVNSGAHGAGHRGSFMRLTRCSECTATAFLDFAHLPALQHTPNSVNYRVGYSHWEQNSQQGTKATDSTSKYNLSFLTQSCLYSCSRLTCCPLLSSHPLSLFLSLDRDPPASCLFTARHSSLITQVENGNEAYFRSVAPV